MTIKSSQNGLNKFSENLKKLHGYSENELTELFDNEFMEKNTNSESFAKFVENYPLNFDETAIHSNDWNVYVSQHTNFNSFDEMCKSAMGEMIKKSLRK